MKRSRRMTEEEEIAYLEYLASDWKSMQEEAELINRLYGYKASPDELPYCHFAHEEW